MKKFFPYIFILIILANIFAPFSVTKNTKIVVEKKIVLADGKFYITNEKDNQSGLKIGSDGKIIYDLTFAPKFFNTEKDCNDKKEDFTKALNQKNEDFYCKEYVKKEGSTTGYKVEVNEDITTLYSTTQTPSSNITQVSKLPACSFTPSWLGGGKGTFVGCIAQGLYYVLYVPSAWLFAGSGQFFDWMFNYSIDDASYKTSFVTEGWKIVRDLCNVFFIFILLYVAFALILDLPNIKAKDMLVNVIIIGLLINFSMFFAKVIIDSSNILARVFYNSQTIEQKSGNAGLGDEISLSQAVVDKLDPQEIVKRAGEIQVEDPISGQSSNAGASATKNLSAGGFILVTLLATIVNIIGIFVFISVALVFVARVIGLYFILIFAPFAFLSYIVPALSKIKMIGWQNWLGDLAKLSFVAPLFMFMLYLIILFLEKGFGAIVQKNNTGVLFVLSVIIPFVFIMIMLLYAKKLAKEYSGEMGKAVTGVVNKVAGVAGGVALGAGAVALRGTVGRAGSAIASSDRLKRAEAGGGIGGFGAKMLLKGGKAAGEGSMDLRGAKIGGKGLSDIGSISGKPQVGGFSGMRAKKVEDRQKRMRELEVGEDSELNQNVRTAENNLNAAQSDPNTQNTINTLTAATRGLEGAVTTAERNLADAERALRDAIATSGGANTPLANAARNTVNQMINRRNAANAALTQNRTDLTNARQPIENAENALRDARNAVIAENRERRQNYAETIQGGWSQSINFITSGGQHSTRGEREAANRILSNIQQESNT